MEAVRHILVVDDDHRLRQLLRRYLVQNGYAVSLAADVADARRQLARFAFDLVVLDLMLPDEDGLVLAREIRRNGELPVLLLTARGEPEERIAGLEAGADDYIVKPFEPRELLLRIATILRRAARHDPGAVRFGPYRFDLRRQELLCDGEPVHLTGVEASLLALLAREPGRPMSRDELARGSRVSGSDRAVDVQMARLRRKLEEDPKNPRYLVTVRGEGYALRTEG